MHTYMPNDRIRIHHHGDLSGEVIIADKEKDVEIRMDMDDLLDFVAHRYVARRLEEIIAKADIKTLLLLIPMLREIK